MTKQYWVTSIEGWDWSTIKLLACCRSGSKRLGSVQGLYPSGKARAVTREEKVADHTFYQALVQVAESHGMWIEQGEDVYACCNF